MTSTPGSDPVPDSGLPGSGMATGNDEGTPGEHLGLGTEPSPVAAPSEVVAAMEDDAPLPASAQPSGAPDDVDPDTPVFREP